MNAPEMSNSLGFCPGPVERVEKCLLRDAGGGPGAAQYYHKALYLELNHRDAVLQMALLVRNQIYLAGLFRSRAERSQPAATQP